MVKNELLLRFVMVMDSMREGFCDGDYKDLWKYLKEDVFKVYEVMCVML